MEGEAITRRMEWGTERRDGGEGMEEEKKGTRLDRREA